MLRKLARKALTFLLIAAVVLSVLSALRVKLGPRLPRLAPWARSRNLPPRSEGARLAVDPSTVWVDDGDTVRVRWPDGTRETVRILGIDAPEVRHQRDPSSRDQPYGPEAREFARKTLLGARRLELLRSPRHDRYQRTLGYLFVDGVNFSVLAVENHLAESTIERFGDSGLPREAAEVRAAGRRAGPPPFESPRAFRDRADAARADRSPAAGIPRAWVVPRPARSTPELVVLVLGALPVSLLDPRIPVDQQLEGLEGEG